MPPIKLGEDPTPNPTPTPNPNPGGTPGGTDDWTQDRAGAKSADLEAQVAAKLEDAAAIAQVSYATAPPSPGVDPQQPQPKMAKGKPLPPRWRGNTLPLGRSGGNMMERAPNLFSHLKFTYADVRYSTNRVEFLMGIKKMTAELDAAVGQELNIEKDKLFGYTSALSGQINATVTLGAGTDDERKQMRDVSAEFRGIQDDYNQNQRQKSNLISDIQNSGHTALLKEENDKQAVNATLNAVRGGNVQPGDAPPAPQTSTRRAGKGTGTAKPKRSTKR